MRIWTSLAMLLLAVTAARSLEGQNGYHERGFHAWTWDPGGVLRIALKKGEAVPGHVVSGRSYITALSEGGEFKPADVEANAIASSARSAASRASRTDGSSCSTGTGWRRSCRTRSRSRRRSTPSR